MKITRRQLRQIIKEEVERSLNETPGPKSDEDANAAKNDIDKAVAYHVNKIKEATGNKPESELMIDTGDSSNIQGGKWITVLSSLEKEPRYLTDARYKIDGNRYDLINGWEESGGFELRLISAGWEKPPSSWGYDSKWTVSQNWVVAPYTD